MKNRFLKTFVIPILLLTMQTTAQEFKTIDNTKLNITVFNASETSFGVASVIISGKEEAILVDTQFTLENAEKVAKQIKDSGKNLTSIYVSHGDPDFYFGLEVFKKHFPNVIAYASPATVAHIKKTAQKKLDVWGSKLGNKITSNVVLPQVLKGNALVIEGEQLEIVGLEKFPHRTFVWIPSIKTVVGGINIFGTSFHLWMADAQTTEARNKWITVLEQIENLNPEIVIPAHGAPDTALNITTVKHTKSYIQFYEKALKKHKTSTELVNVLKQEFPKLNFEAALQLGAKVTTGEMKW